MEADFDHVAIIHEQISALSDALAHLGKGTTLAELIKIIRFPGWTTPAEFEFTTAMLSGMREQVAHLEKSQMDLLKAANMVIQRCS